MVRFEPGSDLSWCSSKEEKEVRMSGKIVISGDWQAMFGNLGRLSKYVDWLESLGGPGVHLILTGDLKEKLNPIDGRVLNWLRAALIRLRHAFESVTILKGNHDQYSVSAESETALRLIADGETFNVVEKPECVRIPGMRTEVYCLPYAPVEEMREALRGFATEAKPHDVLVFHAGIQSARLNALQLDVSDESLTLEDLQHKRYAACFGGHFHYRQQIADNTWFVGSPFAHSWSEANQLKGAIRYDTETRIPELLDGPIPGWYDPDLPGFVPPESWDGARVRIRVPLEAGSLDAPAILKAAEVQARAMYPGADIEVEKLLGSGIAEALKGLGSDAEVIAEFTGAMPGEAAHWRYKMASFLLRALDAVSIFTRNGGGVRFLTLEGENVLSYEHVKIDFQNPHGLRLVTAKNEDWDGRSNGGGKTSYMQLLAVALWGRSLKGQKADRWKRRGSKGASWLKLTMQLPDGRELLIERRRSPKPSVRLYVDGKDETTGMGDADVIRTIENLTGVTWSIITAAIYIDQRGVNKLLSGTDTERKQIVSDFLNLDRFSKGLKVIKVKRDKVQRLAGDMDSELQLRETTLRNQQGFLATLQASRTSESIRVSVDLGNSEQRLSRLLPKLAEAGRDAEAQASEIAKVNGEIQKLSRVLNELEFRGRSIQSDIERAKRAAEDGKCGQCGAVLKGNKAGLAMIVGLEAKLQTIKGDRKGPAEADVNYKARAREIGLRESQARDLHNQLAQEVAGERSTLRAIVAEAAKLETLSQDETRTLERIAEGKKAITRARGGLESLQEDLLFFGHAVRAFSKDGIPALISSRLCPRLNEYALYYSDLFSGGQIGVSFAMVEDDIEISIGNASGGEDLEDQSGGETRMASLIVAFSLRELVSACNILVLDEPGEGLDEVGSRNFAAGLLKIQKHYDTIMLATHSHYIREELEGVAEVLIEKRNGVSRVVSS